MIEKRVAIIESVGAHLFLWAAALLLTCATGTVTAQTPIAQEGRQEVHTVDQTTKGLVLKGYAPVSKELLKVKLPRGREVTLKNGLRVVLIEHQKVPMVTMRMVVMSGGLSDPPGHIGLAQFTANLLREGTSTRSSRQIAEELDSIGAILIGLAGMTSHMSFVTASGQAENFDQILNLLSDVIRNPRFPKEELAKYVAQNLSVEEEIRSQPDALAQERLIQSIYGKHPAGLFLPPTDSLKKTTPADMVRFHSTHYKPNNAVLLIVGDVTMKDVLPKIEKAFGDWKSGPVKRPILPPVPAQDKARIHLVGRPGSVQTELQLGNLAVERVHPDYYALLVMNHIIGGPGGRLFLNLREDKGYTYGVGSFFSGSIFPGTWQASTSVRTEVTREALRELMYELRRMRNELVTARELENAKRALIGRFAISIQLPDSLLQNIFTQTIFDLPANYWDVYIQKVAAVTREDVRRIAQKYIDMAHLQIVAVGDSEKIQASLSEHGAVEIYESKPEKK